MPPAIVLVLVAGWIERTYFGKPLQPTPPQVDTVSKSEWIDRTVSDAVVIEADPEPFEGVAEELGASPRALQRVRDDTVFRSSDDEAWFQIWMTLRSDANRVERAAVREVSFAELFGQPRSFRGRLVKIRGTIHRLQRVAAPPNQFNIEGYWQAWLEPQDGPASPIVVYFLNIPEGFPEGMNIREPVEVVGYFFKRWAYAATDTVRLAPLVMARQPIWRPDLPKASDVNALSTYALITMGALVALTFFGIRLANRAPQKVARQEPTDLTTTLSNIELFSTSQALQRLSETEQGIDPDQTEEKLQ